MFKQTNTNHSSMAAMELIEGPRALDTGGASTQARRWVRLARMVLRRATDDAAQGDSIDLDALRAWAAVAGIPFYCVEQAVKAAAETAPATAA